MQNTDSSVPTVRVKGANGEPLLINKSDYDANPKKFGKVIEDTEEDQPTFTKEQIGEQKPEKKVMQSGSDFASRRINIKTSFGEEG